MYLILYEHVVASVQSSVDLLQHNITNQQTPVQSDLITPPGGEFDWGDTSVKE